MGMSINRRSRWLEDCSLISVAMAPHTKFRGEIGRSEVNRRGGFFQRTVRRGGHRLASVLLMHTRANQHRPSAIERDDVDSICRIAGPRDIRPRSSPRESRNTSDGRNDRSAPSDGENRWWSERPPVWLSYNVPNMSRHPLSICQPSKLGVRSSMSN
jgi:hypothetical protein